MGVVVFVTVPALVDTVAVQFVGFAGAGKATASFASSAVKPTFFAVLPTAIWAVPALPPVWNVIVSEYVLPVRLHERAVITGGFFDTCG